MNLIATFHPRLLRFVFARRSVPRMLGARALNVLVVLSLGSSNLAAVAGPSGDTGWTDRPGKRMAQGHIKAALPATFTRPEPRIGKRPASAADDLAPTQSMPSMPVMFIENVGQFPGP